jgi:hypothetical protein
MKHTILATLIAAFSVSAFAHSFHNQTDAGFGWVDLNDGDFQQWTLAHRFYLSPVNSGSKAPYDEAGFLSRSSSINAGYNYAKFDFSGDEYSVSAWNVGGEYKDVSHKFYAAVNNVELNGTADSAALFSAGYFMQSDWLVKLDARHNRPDGDGSYTEYGVSTKKLLALENGNFINIEARYIDVKDNDNAEFGVAADYYFGRNIALGLAYDWTSDDVVNAADDSVTLRGSWYLQPNLALRAAVVFDYQYSNEELYQLGASYRF